MTLEEFKGTLEAQPFQPFTLRLPDGRSLPIQHRDFVLISPKGRTVVVYQPDGAFNIVDLMLVSDLHVSPNTPAGGSS